MQTFKFAIILGIAVFVYVSIGEVGPQNNIVSGTRMNRPIEI